ncbi:MAG: bile acid:sodium symporter family protein, partial [bacterium]|nr:bile acid:sodium symporter family protein [bacterium]
MTDTPLLTLFLPISLAFIMAGLGLHLTSADFRRVLLMPRAAATALFVQIVALPPLAFALARGFGLPGELGLGLVLLATSPGGVTANLFSHLTRGDVALNITLT